MADTPQIQPLSSKVDPEVRRGFGVLKSWFETHKLVSTDDLLDTGAFQKGTGGKLVPKGEDKDTTVPPALTGFTATGGFASILIEWNDPQYDNLSYVEIWRSTVDNLGLSVMVATTPALVYADTPPSASTAVTYYYWVRIVSKANIAGPFNATEGTPASTATDPAYMLEVLTNQITETELATTLNTRLDGMESNISTLLEGVPEGQSLAASALAAAESANAAAASEANAITAEANAVAAANAAAGSATAAGNSATSANGYATQAANSAGAAGASATAAAQSKTAAEAANTSAGNSAAAASEHSDSAASYATQAGAAATAASTSSTHAATSESNAATYASQTSVSANNAAISATLAGTHAENAAASATTATSAASQATDSAVEAAQSATTALSYVGEAGAVQTEQFIRATTVGPDYDETKSYPPKSVVVYGKKVWQNNQAYTIGPWPWNAAQWTQVTAGMYGQYTVKLDVNGYVSGFGMSNDGTSSLFLVNADKFAVGKTGTADTLPFIVSGGVVYMRAAMIQDGTITNAKIGTAAVDNAKIANLAVSTAKIADASITNAKIANLSVDAAKIADAAITTAKIGNAAITSAKIGDAQITSAKIADAAVDTLTLAGNAVTIPVSWWLATSVNLVLNSEVTVGGAASITIPQPALISALFIASFGLSSPSDALQSTSVDIKLYINGALQQTWGGVASAPIGSGQATTVPASFSKAFVAGTYSVVFKAIMRGTSGGTATASNRSLDIKGAMR